MHQPTSQIEGTLRPWRRIALELATETDPFRILELKTELDTAMRKQGVDAPMDREQVLRAH